MTLSSDSDVQSALLASHRLAKIASIDTLIERGFDLKVQRFALQDE